MKKTLTFIAFLTWLQLAHAQNMVVSSYYVAADKRDSWIELLVTSDNLDIREWLVGDYDVNGGGHLSNYASIKFKSINFWNHLRRGTIILIYCRSTNSSNVPYSIDTSKADGFISVHAQFSAVFDDCPANSDPKLDLQSLAEMITIKYDIPIHSLGHGTNHSNWLMVANPKVINNQAGSSNKLIQVCPGATLAGYDNIIEDTVKTNMTSTGLSLGLPNFRSGNLGSNQAFWNQLREPTWTTPTLTISTNTTHTVDTLRWNVSLDPYSTDLTQGYLILKSNTGIFSSSPVDGTTYTTGTSIGSATIIATLTTSQLSSFVHSHAAECGKIYYRVYAYRYSQDETNGNSYHETRGRAYNQTSFAQGNSTAQNPIPILYHY
ncbi:MAG: hypothetical protein CFE21_12910 [Bacteroidetes bacterium B1(2017)]|nr:MAG: hypothetical protein CFE21_12910 [Bacteroidetes bacterium B1(2017)]